MQLGMLGVEASFDQLAWAGMYYPRPRQSTSTIIIHAIIVGAQVRARQAALLLQSRAACAPAGAEAQLAACLLARRAWCWRRSAWPLGVACRRVVHSGEAVVGDPADQRRVLVVFLCRWLCTPGRAARRWCGMCSGLTARARQRSSSSQGESSQDVG